MATAGSEDLREQLDVQGVHFGRRTTVSTKKTDFGNVSSSPFRLSFCPVFSDHYRRASIQVVQHSLPFSHGSINRTFPLRSFGFPQQV